MTKTLPSAHVSWRLQDERSTHFLVVPGSAISAFSRTPGRLIFAAVNLPFDLHRLAEEYFTKGLRRIDLDPDPITEFGIWVHPRQWRLGSVR